MGRSSRGLVDPRSEKMRTILGNKLAKMLGDSKFIATERRPSIGGDHIRVAVSLPPSLFDLLSGVSGV